MNSATLYVGCTLAPGWHERVAVGDTNATSQEGILAIRWRLPSGTEIDPGFRGKDRGEYTRWLPENTR